MLNIKISDFSFKSVRIYLLHLYFYEKETKVFSNKKKSAIQKNQFTQSVVHKN